MLFTLSGRPSRARGRRRGSVRVRLPDAQASGKTLRMR